MRIHRKQLPLILTAGAGYLDIDAYACMVAMAELLCLRGERAVAWSAAAYNYSICPSLAQEDCVLRELPESWYAECQYIIVDVSDPDYLQQRIPLDRVAAVYDHHVGFEAYWENRIGDNAHIEFLGAAATLIYREWKASGLENRMDPHTARLLIAAILDNTLNLTSANTTQEDVDAFHALCGHAHVDEQWRAAYFAEVQACVEADLRNALKNDTKALRNNPVLPPRVAQLCVWDSESILQKLPLIRQILDGTDSWMLNMIDLQRRCSFFICDDADYQNKISRLFRVTFDCGVARTASPYLRKEIIKETLTKNLEDWTHD